MAEMDLRQTIATRVRDAITERHITQEDLAARTGIPLRTLARRLSGLSTWTVDELSAVSQVLTVTVDSLVA